MSRLDWKRGRFSMDLETNEIEGAIRGRQNLAGDQILYFRYDSEDSHIDPVYDEGDSGGRVFIGPIPVPVMHATHEEGRAEQRPEGFYYNDNLHVVAGYIMLKRLGLTDMDIQHQTYLKDRIFYDGRVFRVLNLQVLGQVQRRDIIVTADATQMQPDEYTGDTAFKAWVTSVS